MLLFTGGVEILRPSIEQFVERARGDGVEVKMVVGEGRSHNYMLLNDISTSQDREESYLTIGEFLSAAHHRRLATLEQ